MFCYIKTYIQEKEEYERVLKKCIKDPGITRLNFRVRTKSWKGFKKKKKFVAGELPRFRLARFASTTRYPKISTCVRMCMCVYAGARLEKHDEKAFPQFMNSLAQSPRPATYVLLYQCPYILILLPTISLLLSLYSLQSALFVGNVLGLSLDLAQFHSL